MTQSKINLLEGSIPKHLIRLTLPMIWGIGVIISFQVVDTYFISKLGKEALAAVSFTFPVTYAIFTLTMGFSVAMSSVVSRLIGEGEQDLICRVITQGLFLVLIFTSLLSVIGFLIQEPLFHAMGAQAHLMPLILDYVTLWLFSIPLIAIPLVGNSSLRAGGDAITPAIIMSIAAFTNLILDPLLIFGVAGFPKMGIEGAALATVIANFCALCASLYVLSVRKKRLKWIWIMDLSAFKDTCKRLLVIALPVGITSLILPLTNAIIIALLSGLSIEAVAAFGIATRIEAFAFIVLMALSTAMSPIIGQNWGAKNLSRVHETLKKAIGFNIIWSLGVAVLLLLFGKHIASLFSTDPDIIQIAQLFFWIVPLSYALSNLLNGWMSAFNAMGNPKRSLTMMFIKYILMLLPALWIGQFYGVVGIFSALALVNIVSGILFHILNWKMCKT